MAKSVSVLSVLVCILTLLDEATARCYYQDYGYYQEYYCSTYISSGVIAGAVVGSLIFVAIIVGVIVFIFCIRRRRMPAAGTVITGTAPGVTIVTSGQQMSSGGGCANPSMYPPQTTAYPPAATGYNQYGNNTLQVAFDGVNVPPPDY